MNDDLRRVFETALPDNEPPTALSGDLAAIGRRRHRRRRLGVAASGATLAVAGMAAVVMAVPGLIPGAAEQSAANANAETDPKVLSDEIREGMADAFPGVTFIMSDEGTGDKPFELRYEEFFDLRYLRGEAGVEVDGKDTGQVVSVALIPPGDWTAEPQELYSDEGETKYLLECADNVEGITPIGVKTDSDCDTVELDGAGMLGTSLQKVTGTKYDDPDIGVDNRGKNGVRHANALHRLDGTAVTLFNGCGFETTDLKTCEESDLITPGSPGVEEYLRNAPIVALEYKKE